MKVLSPNQSLLMTIIETYKQTKDINKTTQKANEWQKERQKVEKEIFGKEITSLLSEQDVRNAVLYFKGLKNEN